MNGISKDYGAVSSVEELLEQEEKGKTKREKNLDLLIQLSPFLMGVLALLEYFYVPNHHGFEASYVYAFFLLLLLLGNVAFIIGKWNFFSVFLSGEKAKEELSIPRSLSCFSFFSFYSL